MSLETPGWRGVRPELGAPERVVEVVFGCRPEDVRPEVILSPFIPLRAFRRHLEEDVLELSPPFFFKGLTGSFGSRSVTVIATGVGPSRVGDCLGFLSFTPARRVFFAGAVGGLARGHAIGDFFVPTEVADGEGYTRYATRPFEDVAREAPAAALPEAPRQALERFLAAEGIRPVRGRVFTVGAITAESQENLHTLARLGYDAVEMELSAFRSAAALHGFEPTALTYVSDLPLGSSLWAEKTPEEQEALRTAYRLLPLLALRYLAAG